MTRGAYCRFRRKLAIGFGAIFIGLVWIPLATLTLGVDPVRVDGRLHSAPGLPTHLGDVLRLPGLTRSWFAERFGFRGCLVRLHGLMMTRICGESPSRAVVLGNQGWLFYADEKVIDDYRNLAPLSPDMVGVWADFVIGSAHACRHPESAYVFLIAPNKHTIYGQYLPSYLKRRAGPSRMDQVLAELDRRGHVCLTTDARGELSAAATRDRVFHKTDTHWNKLGAAIAFNGIAGRLQGQGVEVEPVPLSGLTLEKVEVPGGDLARMAGLRPYLPEIDIESPARFDRTPYRPDGSVYEEPPLDEGDDSDLTTYCPDAPDITAVVFHDSFGIALRPYLARAFRRTRFVLSDVPVAEVLEEEDPDVVVHQIVERKLMRDFPGAPW